MLVFSVRRLGIYYFSLRVSRVVHGSAQHDHLSVLHLFNISRDI